MSAENTEQKKADAKPKAKAERPKETQPTTEEAKRAIVVQRFRDVSNFDLMYEVGADVSHLDKARIKELTDKGLIELK